MSGKPSAPWSDPKPMPAAPQTMIAGVTLDTNIASTCWMPSGTALASGGSVVGIAELLGRSEGCISHGSFPFPRGAFYSRRSTDPPKGALSG
jgi:hypothetical protein